jgi:hypothetical protein
MGSRKGLVVTCALLFGIVGAAVVSHAAPIPVTVHLRVHSSPDPGEVLVRAVGGERTAEVRAVPRGEADGFVTDLNIPGPGVWTVDALAQGFWSAPKTVVVPGERTVTLDLWKTGEIVLRAKLQEGGKVTSPTVTLWSPPDRGGDLPALDGVPFSCLPPVQPEAARFQCTVPAGTWDVRLRIPGHVSRYLWDLKVDPGKARSLGTVTFRRGASVVGWVAATGNISDLSRTVLTLLPYMQGPQYADEVSRTSRTAPTTRANARGFFHLAGVAPGRYLLRASAPGYAVAEVGPFDVFPGAETTLPREVLLQEPARLTVLVNPPSDPWERRWTVELHRLRSETWAVMDRVAGGETDAGGSWSHDGLRPGRYRVVVADAEGSRWWDEDLKLEAGSHDLRIEMPLLRTCGRVTAAGEPVMAHLEFRELRRTADGAPEGSLVGVPLESDREGVFDGWLPHPGEWLVAVDAPSANIRRTTGPFVVEADSGDRCAEMAIDLPGSGITGTVADEQGRPVGGARVTAVVLSTREDVPPALLGTVSEADGSFSLEGLDSGRYTVTAKSGGQRSESVTVVVGDETPAEGVTLILEASDRLRGTVTSPFGPVGGAMVMMLVPGHAEAAGPGLTAPDGSFELDVPSGVAGGTLVVAASGFCLHFSKVALPAEDPLSIVVEQGCGDLLVRGPSEPAGRDVVLFSPGGASLSGTFFPGWNSMNGLPRVREGGLLLGRLRPGSYLVCAGASPMMASPGGRCERVTVVGGSVTEVGLDPR